jgi:hypothetical protein
MVEDLAMFRASLNLLSVMPAKFKRFGKISERANTRLERTRLERASWLSYVGELLKRSVRQLPEI